MDAGGSVALRCRIRRAGLSGTLVFALLVSCLLPPDACWPAKVREGRQDDIVKCTKCGEQCSGNVFQGLPVACVEWE